MKGNKNNSKKKSKRVVKRNIKDSVDIVGILFDQDIITRNYDNEIFEEGKVEGMQQVH